MKITKLITLVLTSLFTISCSQDIAEVQSLQEEYVDNRQDCVVIYYDDDNSNNIYDIKIVKEGDNVPTLTTLPKKEGCRFISWDKSGKVYSNMELHPIWKVETCKITFMNYNETVLYTEYINYGDKVTNVPNIEFVNPDLAYMNEFGYWMDENGTKIDDVANTVFTRSTIIYPKYKKGLQYITYMEYDNFHRFINSSAIENTWSYGFEGFVVLSTTPSINGYSVDYREKLDFTDQDKYAVKIYVDGKRMKGGDTVMLKKGIVIDVEIPESDEYFYYKDPYATDWWYLPTHVVL